MRLVPALLALTLAGGASAEVMISQRPTLRPQETSATRIAAAAITAIQLTSATGRETTRSLARSVRASDPAASPDVPPRVNPDLRATVVRRSVRPPARPDGLTRVQAIAPPAATPATASAPTSASFAAWIAGFRTRALEQGITAQTFERAMADVRLLDEVIKLDRNQSEFTKTLWDYLGTAVSDQRVRNGRAAMEKHAAALRAIELRYGVPGEIVVGIWGLETSYGAFTGSTPTLSSLATLAAEGRRAAFFEAQLVAALRIIQAGEVTPARMKGSWAGAMGHTQFMPTSYLDRAVDFDGDGRRDIWGEDPTDALASAAAYLAGFGWRKGEPWGMEVRLPTGFDYGLTGVGKERPASEWTAMGVRQMDGTPLPDNAEVAMLTPAGHEGAAFARYPNFNVIERYNPADAYVIGVGHLADRIAGGPAIQSGWPLGDRALTRDERMEMQRLLTQAGYDPGGVDGLVGPKTLAALQSWQSAQGLVPDGYASPRLLDRLRR